MVDLVDGSVRVMGLAVWEKIKERLAFLTLRVLGWLDDEEVF